MHKSLLAAPNALFYSNLIKSGYVRPPDKHFAFSNCPFLFIDVDEGQEQVQGTSMYNR